MDRSTLADCLNDLLASEVRSLARHLDEAKPHLTVQTYRAWTDVQHMAATSSRHARTLSDLLDRLRLRERPRPFPPVVANYHFLQLSAILPLLIAEKKQQLAKYEHAIPAAGHDADTAAHLQALQAENQADLQKLETCLAAISGKH